MADKNNVMVGKPRVAGSVYRAATTATLPDNATSDLGNDFKPLGYISDAGVVWSYGSDSDAIRAWGGDVVADPVTNVEDTAKFTMIETVNEEAMKAFWGNAAAVTGGYALSIGTPSPVRYAWVFDMLIPWRPEGPNELEGASGFRRIVIPSAAVGDRDDLSYTDDELVAYGVTLQADADANGKYHKEYVRKPEVRLEIMEQPPAQILYSPNSQYITSRFCKVYGRGLVSVRLQKLTETDGWVNIFSPEMGSNTTLTLSLSAVPVGSGLEELQDGDQIRAIITSGALGPKYYTNISTIVLEE